MWGWLTTCHEIKVTRRFIFIKARNRPDMTEIFERMKGEKGRFKELLRMSFGILRCRCAFRTLKNAIKMYTRDFACKQHKKCIGKIARKALKNEENKVSAGVMNKSQNM